MPRVKGNAVLRIDVAVQKGGDLGREAEGFIEGGAREAQLQQIGKNGQVRPCPGQVAAAGLIPGVLEDRRHLPVVPDREELPVISEKRGGRQRFGQAHLGGLVDHHQIKVGFRPVQLPAPGGALFEEPIEPTGCAPDDEQGGCEQCLPLLPGALGVVPVRQEHLDPCWHHLVQVVADFGQAYGRERGKRAVLAMASQEFLPALRHAVQHNAHRRMRLRRHGHPERPRATPQRPGARQDGQAQRVALARARGALHDQHLLGVVGTHNGVLRSRQPGRLLRLRRQVGTRQPVPEPGRPDHPQRLGGLRVRVRGAQPAVEGIGGRVLAGLQILVGVQVIDHLVERVDLPRVQVSTAVGVAKGGRAEGQALQLDRELGVTDGADDA